MDTNITEQTTTVSITATLIPVEERPDAFFRHFGPACLVVERLVYAWARHLSPDYDGGFWQFYELSNGGFYMAPAKIGSIRFFCEGNGSDCELSPDAFGIVICLFAFGDGSIDLTDAYWQVRDYADNHPEADLIYEAID